MIYTERKHQFDSVLLSSLDDSVQSPQTSGSSVDHRVIAAPALEVNARARSGIVESPGTDDLQVGGFDRSECLVDISIVGQERQPVCVGSGKGAEIRLSFVFKLNCKEINAN